MRTRLVGGGRTGPGRCTPGCPSDFSPGASQNAICDFVRSSAPSAERLSSLLDDLGPTWSASPINWGDGSKSPYLPAGQCIDLRTGPGLRVGVQSAENTSRLVVEFHHACCDGIAALAFLEDLMIAYAQACDPDNAPQLSPLDPARLAERGVFTVESSAPPPFWVGLRDLWITIREWAVILIRNPIVLATPAERPSDVRAEFASEMLASEEVAALRRLPPAKAPCSTTCCCAICSRRSKSGIGSVVICDGAACGSTCQSIYAAAASVMFQPQIDWPCASFRSALGMTIHRQRWPTFTSRCSGSKTPSWGCIFRWFGVGQPRSQAAGRSAAAGSDRLRRWC